MSDLTTPKLRTDILTGRSVIVAPGRAERPGAQQTGPDLCHPSEGDPFLEGSEQATPGEVVALRKPNSAPNQPGWLVRVVPNQYPALSPNLQSIRRHGMFEQSSASGTHDVVIETPDERRHLTDMSSEEFARVLTAWQIRVRMLEHTPDISAVTVFRNEGFQAGASLPHVHSQIIGTNSVPAETEIRRKRADEYRRKTGQDLLDDLCAAELREEARIVKHSRELMVLCPFAGRFTRQVRFVPQPDKRLSFSQSSAEMILEVAAAIRSVVGGMAELHGSFAFNLCLMQPPCRHADLPWFVDLMPRMSGLAGFELATDVDIVMIAPEAAAQELRRIVRWDEPDPALVHPAGFEWVMAR